MQARPQSSWNRLVKEPRAGGAHHLNASGGKFRRKFKKSFACILRDKLASPAKHRIFDQPFH
jgi:hypothetical protein